jgi:hypothetical protein
VLTQFKGSLQMLDTKPSNEFSTASASSSTINDLDDEIPF